MNPGGSITGRERCTFPRDGYYGAKRAKLVASLVARPAAQAAEPDPWFGRDKAMHFSVSFALAGNAYADSSAFTKRASIRVLSGVGVGLAAGIAKELADQYGGRGLSWRDLTWDAVGTATGTLVAWLVDRYLL